MRAVRIRFIMSFLVVSAAGALFAATPLWACHEPTGWCCSGMNKQGHPFCCKFIDNVMDKKSCGYKDEMPS